MTLYAYSVVPRRIERYHHTTIDTIVVFVMDDSTTACCLVDPVVVVLHDGGMAHDTGIHESYGALEIGIR